MVENHERRTTYNTRVVDVGSIKNERPEEIIEKLTVFGGRSIDIMGDDNLVVMKGDKGRDILITDGNYFLTVLKGDYKLSLTQGDSEIETLQGNIKVSATTGKITMEAAQAIELKVGSSSLKLDQTGVTIKGPMINIKGMAITNIKGTLVKIN